ncbi:MAG: SAP domain-containing protein [Anaerolineae bacterium]|nr:SAP domain-containing protein [Anaerolineae bacterium]MCO5203863.1 SAP domain-containing protein [Anaerolineae bacterium]
MSNVNLNQYTVPALKEMLRERDLKVGGRKAELIARLERALAAEAAAAQNAPAGPSADQQEFYEVLEGLNEVVEELQETVDGYDPPPYSRQALLNLLRENMVKFTPDMRIGILRELKQVSAGMSPQDILDPDTWKGMWFLLNYTAHSKAEELQQSVSGLGALVQQLPGGETLVGLGQIAQNIGPRDLLEVDTYRGIWFLASYTAQSKAQELKQMVLGETDN